MPSRRTFICSLLLPAAIVVAGEPRVASAETTLGWLQRILGVSAETPQAALTRRGGSRVLLQADDDEVRTAVLNDLRNDMRAKLRDARIGYRDLAVRDGQVEVHVRDLADLPRALAALGMGVPAGQPAGDTQDASEGLIRLTPPDSQIGDRLTAALNDAAAVIAQRMKELGVESPGAEREGIARIRVLLPGVKDPAPLLAMMAARGQLTFRLIDVSATPEEARRVGGFTESDVLHGFRDKALYLVEKRVAVSGRDIAEAQPGFDPATNQPIVSFRFSARGAADFARTTQENVGRPFAIVLDNEVISAPVIREPILRGSGQISGGFTVADANNLAVLLRAGTLPLSLAVIEQQSVAPASK